MITKDEIIIKKFVGTKKVWGQAIN